MAYDLSNAEHIVGLAQKEYILTAKNAKNVRTRKGLGQICNFQDCRKQILDFPYYSKYNGSRTVYYHIDCAIKAGRLRVNKI